MEVIVFGCPRGGNYAFRKFYNERIFKALRIENGNDIVTKIPLLIMGYRHVGEKIHIGRKRSPFLFSFKSHAPQAYFGQIINRLYRLIFCNMLV